MTAYDLGDGVNLDHLVYDRDNAPIAATVALAVTNPSGVTTNPTITNPALGHYRAATFTANVVGVWSYVWTVSGTVTDVAAGSFYVTDPAPAPYVTLPEMKRYLGIGDTDTADDERLASALDSVSREIESVCGRVFTTALTATVRTYTAGELGYLRTDDFYTTTGLLVDGVAYASSSWTLYPRNGINNGQTGWPYNRIRALSGWSCGTDVAITAKWGWPAVPAPVVEACKIAASDTFGLKDARFGVAGFNDFGPMRVRDNHAVMAKLQPYVRDVIMVA